MHLCIQQILGILIVDSDLYPSAQIETFSIRIAACVPSRSLTKEGADLEVQRMRSGDILCESFRTGVQQRRPNPRCLHPASADNRRSLRPQSGRSPLRRDSRRGYVHVIAENVVHSARLRQTSVLAAGHPRHSCQNAGDLVDIVIVIVAEPAHRLRRRRRSEAHGFAKSLAAASLSSKKRRVAISSKTNCEDGAEAVCRSAEGPCTGTENRSPVSIAALESNPSHFRGNRRSKGNLMRRVTVSLAANGSHFCRFRPLRRTACRSASDIRRKFLKALVCTPLHGALADHCVSSSGKKIQAACRRLQSLPWIMISGAAHVRVIVARPLLRNAEAGKIRDPDRIVEHHRLAASGLDRA